MKNNDFKIPIKFSINYFFVRHKFLWNILILVATVILILFLNNIISKGLLKFPTVSSTTIAIFGVFTGALISGVISFFLQKREIQTKLLIDKKINIYEPIYDELVNLKSSIKDYPYPYHIYFRKSDATVYSWGFTEWGLIQSDHRYYEVTKWLRNALDSFKEDLKKYYEKKQYTIEACNQSFMKLEEKYKLFNVKSLEPHGMTILRAVLSNDFNEFIQFPKNKVSEDEQEMIIHICESFWKELCPTLMKIEEVIDFEIYYQQLNLELDWLIENIRKVMFYINLKYISQRTII